MPCILSRCRDFRVETVSNLIHNTMQREIPYNITKQREGSNTPPLNG